MQTLSSRHGKRDTGLLVIDGWIWAMLVDRDFATPVQVVLIAVPGVSAFHLSVPLAIFETAFEEDPTFAVRVASDPDEPEDAGRFSLRVDGGLALLDDADVVIVAGWADLARAPSAGLKLALQRAHARGAYVVGLCYGAYALAYAGLLDGHRASTHWLAEADFQQRFPAVTLDINALYVDEARLVTSAGTAAGLDCCLYLVRAICGARYANRVARAMVLAPHRDGGQAQFIEQPMAEDRRDTVLGALLADLREDLTQEMSIDSLAKRVAMSRRTFTRRFGRATGMSVAKWVDAERLRKAKDLLETTQMSIDYVAERSGFKSPVSFRQTFKRVMQVSPSEWRRSFGVISEIFR